MNVFELSVGHIKHFVAAADEQDAYNQGTDPYKFPDIHFLPFQIQPVIVEGHTITVTPIGGEEQVTRRGRKPASV